MPVIPTTNSTTNQTAKSHLPLPIKISLLLTSVIFLLGLIVFYCKEVWQLPGNEIGDFFAGFSGALSFIWIIATIFLQKDELALQRAEVSRLAEEARAQGQSLLVAARTNFRVRWDATIRLFFDAHEKTLNSLNIDIAHAFTNKPAVIDEFEKFRASRSTVINPISAIATGTSWFEVKNF